MPMMMLKKAIDATLFPSPDAEMQKTTPYAAAHAPSLRPPHNPVTTKKKIREPIPAQAPTYLLLTLAVPFTLSLSLPLFLSLPLTRASPAMSAGQTGCWTNPPCMHNNRPKRQQTLAARKGKGKGNSNANQDGDGQGDVGYHVPPLLPG
jgi:hypothetical protein